ncbi:MAG: multidrug efflux RND transporter permease subunit [Alphaproteobacteria bacterium]
MRISSFFIDRPIFASVVAILIVIVGAVSYFRLPVSEYPEIVPPTIQVSATYPGASAEVVADTVATTIEQEINGIEGMLYMLSQSTADGRLTLTITFELGTDLDEAQVLVQNRVSIAEPRLPEEVRRLGVSTRKNSPDLMMVIHLLSPDDSRDQLYISNYARTQVIDRLARIEGVGQATIFAERAYSMRIWLDPERVAAYDLTASEVVAALRQNNIQVASGAVNQIPVPDPGAFQISVQTQGRLVEPEAFGDIVIKTDIDGGQVRVSDVARIELGAQDYSINGYLDRNVALPIGIFQRPGSNALETSDALLAEMADIAKSFPSGVDYQIVYNPTEFIQESINAVYETILEAILLVVLVILVFLQTIRAAIIPIVAIPISLIGTFFVMDFFGFSVNNLTLFGLVLSIGIVVDDAIVVVENIERFIRDGMSPREAAHKTMKEVSGALVAISLVLVAVFLPSAFLEGISGQFFRQFAVTIVTATVISLFVSLTLSPALCAILMKPHASSHEKREGFAAILHMMGWPVRKFSEGFNWFFGKLSTGYALFVKSILRISVVALVAYAGLIWFTGYQFQQAPRGFIPTQDQGYLIAILQLPPGASLDRTDTVVLRAVDIALQEDGVASAVGIVGLDGATFTNAPNAAVVFLPLAPFEERLEKGLTDMSILGKVSASLQSIKEANIFVVGPPPVRGVGTTGGWKMYVQDRRGRGYETLESAAQVAIGQAFQAKEVAYAFTVFNTATPRIYADIDRVKAQQIGVLPGDIFETLEIYLGSAFVNDFNFLGRTYRVTAQADGQFRDTVDDIAELRIRSSWGDMTPIGSVATFENRTGPYRVARYNLYPAAAIQGTNNPGVSTGEAITAMESALDANLPDGFSYEWTDLALQEKLAGDASIYVFGLAVVFTFLLLAAQYESWLLPLSVILIVPMCLLAAVSGVIFRGMDNNILTQIGFVVLIGLAAKNAILIVEFAKQSEDRGLNRVEAAIEACRLRLRPILMTAFAFILGVVPLLIATGAGAEMRQALGTAVFYGMLGVTFFGLIFTPVFYVTCRWLGSLGSKNA